MRLSAFGRYDDGRGLASRDLTIAEIKTIARQQMADSGTAGVSLSAIARAMEVSAPALCRYFASRDDLVTALIVDAFNALADAIQAAESAVERETNAQKIIASRKGDSRQWHRMKPLSPKSSHYPTGGNQRASLPVAGHRSRLARWPAVGSTRATSALAKEVSWRRAKPV